MSEKWVNRKITSQKGNSTVQHCFKSKFSLVTTHLFFYEKNYLLHLILLGNYYNRLNYSISSSLFAVLMKQ